MPDAQVAPVLRQLRRLAAAPLTREMTDRDLLAAFARRADEGAFAAVVERHGPMVLRVCRRVLRHAAGAAGVGGGGGGVSMRAASLAAGVNRAMHATKLKAATLLLAAAFGLAAAGGVILMGGQPAVPPVLRPADPTPVAPTPREATALRQGKWALVEWGT